MTKADYINKNIYGINSQSSSPSLALPTLFCRIGSPSDGSSMAPKPSHDSPPAVAINIEDVEFCNRAARFVCDFYDSLRIRGGIPQTGQWTVLAAFLLYTKPLESEAQGSLSILTLATGNKCVAVPIERDKQVIDMHAEILARRELELLLLEGLQIDDSDLAGDPQLSASQRLAYDCLQSLVSSRAGLYLYSSHMPCGSASDVAHLDRLDTEDKILKEVIWGGNHTPEQHLQSTFRSDRSGTASQLSKKPSRADAEPTESYSCSDKLSRYQILGFQGGRLGGVFEERNWPFIRLAGIIGGEDFLVGKGLQTLFGGTVQATATTEPIGKSYSRMVDGLTEIFQGHADSFIQRFHIELMQRTAQFRIFGTDHIFKYSRQAVLAQHRTKVPLSECAQNAFSALSIQEQTRIRLVPLALARDLLLPSSPVQSFPISTHWRAGQDVQVLNPSGILNGHKATRPIRSTSTSRVCRARMKETCSLICDPTDKGGPRWKRVSKLMEVNGPWKDWHKFA